MSRLYTGQHGEFFFWAQDGLFGSTENFRIAANGGAVGIEHKIQRLERLQRRERNNSCTARNRSPHSLGKGWMEEQLLTISPAIVNFVADGDTAAPPSGWRWTQTPLAKVDIPGNYRRIGTVRNWSFSNTAETIDTTTLGDTYRGKIGGLKSVTGQAQLMYYRDDDNTDGPISNMLDAFRYQDSETIRNEIR